MPRPRFLLPRPAELPSPPALPESARESPAARQADDPPVGALPAASLASHINGRRQALAAVLGALCNAGFAGAALAAPRRAEAAEGGLHLRAARLLASGRGIQLLLEGAGAAHSTVAVEATPPRVVLTLPALQWSGPRRLQGAGIVRVVEARRLGRGEQITLHLTGPIAAPRLVRGGGNLRLTVLPGSAPEFARLTGSGGASASSAGGSTGRSTGRTTRAPLPLVVIDPGHGGKDPGTTGLHGTEEKRINLAVGLELRRVLEQRRICRVAMTRSTDVFIPLEGRVAFAQKRGAVLFVSLHADSAPPDVQGASVYTLSGSASDKLSAQLADRENQADSKGGPHLPRVPPEVASILASLVRRETTLGSERLAQDAVRALQAQVTVLPRTHRRAGFVVLKSPEIPSMLVEMGFLTNAKDEALLRQPQHRHKIAEALATAIGEWLQTQATLAAG